MKMFGTYTQSRGGKRNAVGRKEWEEAAVRESWAIAGWRVKRVRHRDGLEEWVWSSLAGELPEEDDDQKWRRLGEGAIYEAIERVELRMGITRTYIDDPVRQKRSQ